MPIADRTTQLQETGVDAGISLWLAERDLAKIFSFASVDLREVLRKAADDVGNFHHALSITHGAATELVDHVHLRAGQEGE